MGNPGQFRFWQVSVGGILGVIRYAHLLRASQLGRTAWHKDAGIWQMPGTLSHFRAGPEPSASSERPWHWVFPGDMEGCLGKWEGRGRGKAYTPGLPACGELQPCGLSPPRLPHPPEVC